MFFKIKHKELPDYTIKIETQLRPEGLFIWAWPTIKNVNKYAYQAVLADEFINSLSTIGHYFEEQKFLLHAVDAAIARSNISISEYSKFMLLIGKTYKSVKPKKFLKAEYTAAARSKIK